MDLVNLIRNIRFFKMAIVSLLPSETIALIKDKPDTASIDDKLDGHDSAIDIRDTEGRRKFNLDHNEHVP